MILILNVAEVLWALLGLMATTVAGSRAARGPPSEYFVPGTVTGWRLGRVARAA